MKDMGMNVGFPRSLNRAPVSGRRRVVRMDNFAGAVSNVP